MGINARLVPDAADTAGARISPVLNGTPAPDAVGLTDGNGNIFKVTDNGDGTATLNVTGAVTTSSTAPAAANVLNGFQSFAATTAATTLITVPAGRTWLGEVGAAVSVANAAAAAAAGQARAVFATAGAGVTPVAGTVLAAEAKAGANAATGTVGSQSANNSRMALTVVAPAGNAVTVTVAATIAGSGGIVDAWASGSLQ